MWSALLAGHVWLHPSSCYCEGGASWHDLPDRISLPIIPCFPLQAECVVEGDLEEGEILEYCSVGTSRYIPLPSVSRREKKLGWVLTHCHLRIE